MFPQDTYLPESRSSERRRMGVGVETINISLLTE
jgi:hypothetical protein